VKKNELCRHRGIETGKQRDRNCEKKTRGLSEAKRRSTRTTEEERRRKPAQTNGERVPGVAKKGQVRNDPPEKTEAGKWAIAEGEGWGLIKMKQLRSNGPMEIT